MMGHTKIATTQIYARVLLKKISDDMSDSLKRSSKVIRQTPNQRVKQLFIKKIDHVNNNKTDRITKFIKVFKVSGWPGRAFGDAAGLYEVGLEQLHKSVSRHPQRFL